jgi:hypothetical protein
MAVFYIMSVNNVAESALSIHGENASEIFHNSLIHCTASLPILS